MEETVSAPVPFKWQRRHSPRASTCLYLDYALSSCPLCQLEVKQQRITESDWMLQGEKEVEVAHRNGENLSSVSFLLCCCLTIIPYALDLVGKDNLSKEWRLILVPREGLTKTFYWFFSIWEVCGKYHQVWPARDACISLLFLKDQQQGGRNNPFQLVKEWGGRENTHLSLSRR